MKIPEKVLRTVRSGFLYSNGRLVLIHEETHRSTRVKVEWVTIHETAIKTAFPGRLMISRAGAVRLILSSLAVDAREPAIDGGSDNTRARALKIGYVSIRLGARTYDDNVYVPIVDGLSGDFELQPAHSWAEHSPYRWGSYPVVDSATGRSVGSL